jgi:hypothetical protein
MKLATFVWSVTIQVPNDFTDWPETEKDNEVYKKALSDAWLEVHERDGEVTDVKVE